MLMRYKCTRCTRVRVVARNGVNRGVRCRVTRWLCMEYACMGVSSLLKGYLWARGKVAQARMTGSVTSTLKSSRNLANLPLGILSILLP